MKIKGLKKLLFSGIVFTFLFSIASCSTYRTEYNAKADKEGFITTSLTKQTSTATYYDYNKTSWNAMGNDVFGSTLPTTGEVKLLVVPIWFDDAPITKNTSAPAKEVIRNDIKNAFFGTGGVKWESVSTFYKKSSFNKLNITGEVTKWITPLYTTGDLRGQKIQSKVYSGRWLNQYYFGNNATEFVEGTTDFGLWNIFDYVMDYLSTSTDYGVDFLKEYDTDEDGFIDGIWFVYNVEDYSRINDANYYDTNYWAYTWTNFKDQFQKVNKGYNLKTKEEMVDDITRYKSEYPHILNFAWGSYDFMYSSDNSFYKSGEVDSHTYIHETGHMLGLDDYYSYDESPTSPMGGIDMMDYNIGDHNGFSKFALGWATPYVVNENVGNISLSIHKASTAGEGIIIPAVSEIDSKMAFNEYIYVEYYTPDGLNKFDGEHSYYSNSPSTKCFTESGIRIYHVDARLGEMKYTRGMYVVGSYATSFSSTNYYNVLSSNSVDSYSSNGFHLISCISKDNSDHYTTTSASTISNSSLFKKGSTFSMSKFSDYFCTDSEKVSLFEKSAKWDCEVDTEATSKTKNVEIHVGYIGTDYANISITF